MFQPDWLLWELPDRVILKPSETRDRLFQWLTVKIVSKWINANRRSHKCIVFSFIFFLQTQNCLLCGQSRTCWRSKYLKFQTLTCFDDQNCAWRHGVKYPIQLKIVFWGASFHTCDLFHSKAFLLRLLYHWPATQRPQCFEIGEGPPLLIEEMSWDALSHHFVSKMCWRQCQHSLREQKKVTRSVAACFWRPKLPRRSLERRQIEWQSAKLATLLLSVALCWLKNKEEVWLVTKIFKYRSSRL